MVVRENPRETRRRVFKVIGITAVGGVVMLSATVLALRISSMMPSVIETPVKAGPPAPSPSHVSPPREAITGERSDEPTGRRANSMEASSGDRRLASDRSAKSMDEPSPPALTAPREVTAVRRQPPRGELPGPTPGALGDPPTEAERTRRTAAWLLRTYDRETAEKYVRDAIAFYPVDDPDGAFWRQVLTTITARVDP